MNISIEKELKVSILFVDFFQEYHLQNALDAQQRLGSAKIRAVPIPDVYEDSQSQTIYPATNILLKELIRLPRRVSCFFFFVFVFDRSLNFFLALQLESEQPEYDMDEIDHKWFNETGRHLCPKLSHLEFERIVDKLEDASTRISVSLDEARALFSSSTSTIINDLHLTNVYQFWHQRRTQRVDFLRAKL